VQGVVVAAAKVLLVRWSPDTCLEIVAFEVICRVIVILVKLSCVCHNLTYNGPAVWLVAVSACPDDRQVVRVAVAWFLPSPGRRPRSFSSRQKCPDG
jgi:hypothetical protein